MTCGLGLTPTCQTGNVYGQSHVQLILKKYLDAEQRRMKEVLALDQGEPWFFGEDHAPGHYHDACSVTKDSGLNEKRQDFFISSDVWRKLTPKKGTPRYMVGDQLHQIFKHRVQQRLEWLIGHEKDLTSPLFLEVLEGDPQHSTIDRTAHRCLGSS